MSHMGKTEYQEKEDAIAEVAALRAEVERLRGLIRDAEWASGGYVMGDPWCPWCERPQYGRHLNDCPAFSARGLVRR